MKKQYRFYLSTNNENVHVMLADWWIESVEYAEICARGMVVGAHVKYNRPLIEIKEVINSGTEILVSSIY